MKEVFYTPSQVNSYLLTIAKEMYKADFRPDYIVGLVRGGLVPAIKLSHYLDIPMYALDPNESNLWMAEDAFGYVPADDQQVIKSRWDVSYRKNILIIDDINDSGKTFTNLKEDWQSGCLPKESAWNTVWHKNVKFATLIENQASDFDADFVGLEINKLENPGWCVFPWERWW